MRIFLCLTLLCSTLAAKREDIITSSLGAPIGDSLNSLIAGPRGPILLQDTVFLEKLARFDRERIPRRVVHPRGAGAFGYFEVTDDITKYSKAKVFSKIGKRTPVLVRFSVAGTESLTDTTRNLRGFAMKFYTDEGNWDLVGMNSPIFFIRDPLLVPDASHSVGRHPVSNLLVRDTFWDILSLRPESTHQLLLFYSDGGIPDGYRYMPGYGANTFKLVNKKGRAVYCKFHLKSDQGIRNLPVDRARELDGTDPDYATRDLYEALERGDFPSWTFYIQVMTFKQAENWYFNPFDVTKIWPEEEFPLIKVGKLVVNRNPRNYFAEIEQAAFCPANLVPGIEASPDKFLQGRLFAYSDTQRHRLGANFKQIPVNCPFRSFVRNYERDGPQTVDGNQDGEVNYYPNSFGGPVNDPSYLESCFATAGDVCRYNSSNEDNFTQAGNYYRKVLGSDERTRLVENIVQDLSQVQEFIQKRAVKNFYQADAELGIRLEEGLRQAKLERTNGMNKKTAKMGHVFSASSCCSSFRK